MTLFNTNPSQIRIRFNKEGEILIAYRPREDYISLFKVYVPEHIDSPNTEEPND